MPPYRDPLLDYLNRQTGTSDRRRDAGDAGNEPPASPPPTPTSPASPAGDESNGEAELRALQEQLRQAQEALGGAQEKLRAATSAKAGSGKLVAGPPDAQGHPTQTYVEDSEARAAAEGDIALAQSQIAQYTALVRTLQTQIAQVQGAIARNKANKPLTPQQQSDLAVQQAAKIAQAQADIRNKPVPYDSANDPEYQRRLAEWVRGLPAQELAQKLTAGRLALDFAQLEENRRQFEETGKRQESARQAAQQENEAGRQATLLGNLIQQTGANQRDTASNTLQTYYKQLERDVTQGRLDEGAALRKLESFKANLDYAKTYGLTSDMKPGYGNAVVLKGLYGQKVNPEDYRQEKFDPFKAMGITPADLAGPSIRLPDRPPPAIAPLDTGQQVAQAQGVLQGISPFNMAQQQPPPAPMPAPPPAPTPAPISLASPAGVPAPGIPSQQDVLSRMIPGVAAPPAPIQPPPGIERPVPPAPFNAGGASTLWDQWQRERRARGEDPNDLGAFAEHMSRLG